MSYQVPRFNLNYANNNAGSNTSNGLYRSNTAINTYNGQNNNAGANTGYNRTYTGLNNNNGGNSFRWTPPNSNTGNNATSW